MTMLAQAAVALQRLFGPCADAAAAASGVILRQRKFTALSLARTFVLGYLAKPTASVEDLAQIAAQTGAAVSPQAVDQRRTPALVKFLQTLFGHATRIVVGASKSLAPLLERFPEVIVGDSSTLQLPDDLQAEFAGCGGSHGAGKAALKLQTELDLRSGGLTFIGTEPGRCPDGGSDRQTAPRARGSLRITDLGYFNLAVFATLAQCGAYFLSRLQIGTQVFTAEGEAVALLSWLARQPGRRPAL